MKTLVTAAMVLALAGSARAEAGDGPACHQDKTAQQSMQGSTVAVTSAAPAPAPASAPDQIPTVTVSQLAQMLQDKLAVPVDANNAKTRDSEGVIPGATLLSSPNTFDPAKELPAQKDANLVFYCANPKCSASHDAAKRAMAAGYKNVQILPDGIMGWKTAGQKAAPMPAKARGRS